MSPRHSTLEPRLDATTAWLTPVIALLNDLHDGFGTPFLQTISSTSLSLINVVQNVKRNQDDCIELIEKIPKILYGIADLHLTSKPKGVLSPAMLDNVGSFNNTLQKIFVFAEAQQGGNKIRHFFRQAELARLLKDCQAGLQHAVHTFRIESGIINFNSINEMRRQSEIMQTEIMELISTFSEHTVSDSSFSIYQRANESQVRPKIFHGRELELQEIVTNLTLGSARIAILGAGGMGKTSLARVALHHPEVIAKYAHQIFVAADSVTGKVGLVTLIASHIGLQPTHYLEKKVVQYFSNCSSVLLVLDNLETAWEPVNSRSEVEGFLSLLTDVGHLALVITMRGAQRPAQVRWTRPFLLPLKPISDHAAWETFMDITDVSHNSEDVTQLLSLTNNIPLAVDLMAHLVDYEGCSSVLTRWDTEKTSILSSGHGKSSNLDASINISLLSPRMTASPGARELLALLAILPDGLSDVDIIQSQIPAKDILACKSVLLSTSLAHTESTRLKVLVPIREYMQRHYPASQPFIQSVRTRFEDLLAIWRKYVGHQLGGPVHKQIASNLANMESVLALELYSNNPRLEDISWSIATLNSFRIIMGHSPSPCMDYIAKNYSQPSNPRLEVHMIAILFNIRYRHIIPNVEHLLSKAEKNFDSFDDPSMKCRFYSYVGEYFRNHGNIPRARQFLCTALELAVTSKDIYRECHIVQSMALCERDAGNHLAAQSNAQRFQKLARLDGNMYLESMGLRVEALACLEIGMHSKTIALFTQARELLHRCGLKGSDTDYKLLSNMSGIYYLKSEYSEAQEITMQIKNATSDQEHSTRHAITVLNLAGITIIMGKNIDHIAQVLRDQKKIFGTTRDSNGLAMCDLVMAGFHLSHGHTAAAQTLLLQYAQFGDIDVRMQSLELLADLKNWGITAIGWVSRWTTVFLAHAFKCQNNLAVHKALSSVGHILLAMGDLNTAQSLFIVALEGFTWMDVHRSRAECMLHLGEISQQRGDFEEAISRFKTARPLFERSSQAKDVEHMDSLVRGLEKEIERRHDTKVAHLSTLNVPVPAIVPVQMEDGLANPVVI
ncbi:hypothetical protein B0H14DRAFT_2561645 [Mycena olivaceomarginata]|nr:hypothetical protein B0H14DRAFT_2561645 [Mycena olivaceomarginata]